MYQQNAVEARCWTPVEHVGDVEHITHIVVNIFTRANDTRHIPAVTSDPLSPHTPTDLNHTQLQGRRSLWDRGTRPPNIWTGGT